ncbi:MAG: hypothetical protein ABI646_01805 [Acidobacteriota bacterium]
MKKHWRVEITAFRRRLITVAADLKTAASYVVVEVQDFDVPDAIDIGPVEEREILVETIRLLEETIRMKAPSAEVSPNGRCSESKEREK